jgi:TRAP-type C4-dicarboxylate transport system permease small subunit
MEKSGRLLVIERVASATGFFALILLTIMMLLTVCDVILRYFGRPIPGAMELTEILMVSVGGLSLAWCTLRFGHIRVDILLRAFPRGVQGWIDVLNYVFTAVLCVLIIPALLGRCLQDVKMAISTYVLKIPEWPFVLVLAFGYLLTLCVLCLHIYRSFRERQK